MHARGGDANGTRRHEARALLRRHWGHDDFRPGQRPALRAMLAGRDLLAVLPTGAGKSVCFQVPALMEPGLTLVVSPLVSLMEDQVVGLRARGVAAASLTAATGRAARRSVERSAAEGTLRLLYVAPERLGTPGFRRLAAGIRVRRLVVDEAHCVSEWGHDFRPAYRRIPRILPLLGRPPVAAFTATATPATRTDVREALGLVDSVLLIASPDRPNLRWRVVRTRDRDAAARAAVATVRRRPGAALIYAPTRRRSVLLAEALLRKGVAAAPYHAGLPDASRRAIQEGFLAGEHRVIAATTAFGMGVDHPHVRTVCHAGCPASLEAYVQQAGRAGRDGEEALCELVAHRGDLAFQRTLIRRSWPPASLVRGVWRALGPDGPVGADEVCRRLGSGRGLDEVESALRLLRRLDLARERSPAGWLRAPDALAGRFDPGVCRRGRRRAERRLRAMARYVRTRGCRRAAITAYFGARPPRCRGCDRCAGTRGADPGPALTGTARREHES